MADCLHPDGVPFLGLVLGLRFALPEASRRHLLRAVAAAVFLVPVVAATPASCRGTSQQNRTSHCDVSAPPDVEASRVTSCRDRRALCAERRCGITVSLQSRRRRWDSLVGFVVFDFRWRNSRGGNAHLETHFQGGTTTFVLQRQPLFVLHDTLHWPRASSFQLPWGRWGQCCHDEPLRFQPS